jgi:hypothetical protein
VHGGPNGTGLIYLSLFGPNTWEVFLQSHII